jgi:NADPH:quinone reductase-like Zn-dependent oxidoreductase
MKAMVIEKYGGPGEFKLREIQLRGLRDDELLVKVAGSSVNPVDTVIRRGKLKWFIRLKMPAVLGLDVAGMVMKTGKNVNRFHEGDLVYAYLGTGKSGGYGEYALVPEAYAARCPKNIPVHEAGTIPTVGLTAMDCFTEHAPLKKGMKVLINGASGGVGTYAVQIAKHFGAVVTAVCSDRYTTLVKSLGADKVIDYNREDVFELPENFDVILNCVRTGQNQRFRKLLNPGGKAIVIAGNPFEMPKLMAGNIVSSKSVKIVFIKPSGKLLNKLALLIEAGSVKPVIDKTYSWTDLAKAHEQMENGRVSGKIAIKVGEP